MTPSPWSSSGSRWYLPSMTAQTMPWPISTRETYGASLKKRSTPWKVSYTFADGGEQRNARLYFSNGILQQVYWLQRRRKHRCATRDHPADR